MLFGWPIIDERVSPLKDLKVKNYRGNNSHWSLEHILLLYRVSVKFAIIREIVVSLFSFAFTGV